VNIPIFENFKDETEGRPCKVYQDLSERSKRRKVQNVSKTMERELASRALAHKYDEENMQKQAEIIRKVDKVNPKRVNRIIGSIPTLKKLACEVLIKMITFSKCTRGQR
jgi:transcriptional regulator of met regulon